MKKYGKRNEDFKPIFMTNNRKNKEDSSIPDFQKYINETNDDFYPSNEMSPDEYFKAEPANPIAPVNDVNIRQDLEDFYDQLPEEIKANPYSRAIIELSFFRPFPKFLMDLRQLLKINENAILLNILEALQCFSCEFLNWGFRDPETTMLLLQEALAIIKNAEGLFIDLFQEQEQMVVYLPVLQEILPPNHAFEWISRLIKFLEESLNWIICQSNITFSINPQALKIQDYPLYLLG